MLWNFYSHSSLCYQALKEKNIKQLKMSGYKSMGQNFMPSSSFIHQWGILKGSGIFLSSIFSLAKYSVFNQLQLSPNKFTQNNLPSICHERLPSILYGVRYYVLAPLEKCRIKLANILTLAKTIGRQNRSVSLWII